MSIKGQGHSLTLVKGHSDFKVKCLSFGLYTEVSDSGPLGPLVLFLIIFSLQVSHPFELVGVDLMGPFVESSQGNKYIFTATDYYTKWVEAFPIPNKSATVVSKCFEKMFSRHGAMNAIITDQGREFINEVICIHKL